MTEAKKSGAKRSLLDKSKQVKARTYLLGANACAFKEIDVSTMLNMTIDQVLSDMFVTLSNVEGSLSK